MSDVTPAKAIAFLEEMARYWDRKPTNGEDMTHWAHVYNAENCRKIASLIASSPPHTNPDRGTP